MHKAVVHLLPHPLFDDLLYFLIGEAVAGVPREQIRIRVIPGAGLCIGEIRADTQRTDLFARLREIQLEAGQLILQVGRGRETPRAVHGLAVLLRSFRLRVFGRPAAFQRLGAVVADQPPALCQRQAGFGVTPLLRRQAVGSFVHHLTAPVMPLAKLFCRQRKMIAVGSVQIRTPSISIP